MNCPECGIAMYKDHGVWFCDPCIWVNDAMERFEKGFAYESKCFCDRCIVGMDFDSFMAKKKSATQKQV